MTSTFDGLKAVPTKTARDALGTALMPSSLHTEFCAKLWPFATKARRKGCPDRVVTMADAVTMVSRRRIQNVPLEAWKSLLDLVKGNSDPRHEQLVAFGWHLLLGQPAVLAHRTMSRH